MINLFEVVETNEMITKENLDVRTITLGISLLDCIDSDIQKLNEKIYKKIYDAAKDYGALPACKSRDRAKLRTRRTEARNTFHGRTESRLK